MQVHQNCMFRVSQNKKVLIRLLYRTCGSGYWSIHLMCISALLKVKLVYYCCLPVRGCGLKEVNGVAKRSTTGGTNQRPGSVELQRRLRLPRLLLPLDTVPHSVTIQPVSRLFTTFFFSLSLMSVTRKA